MLVGSFFWPPLHPDCLVIAFSLGLLTSLFQILHYRISNRYCLALYGWFRLALPMAQSALLVLATRPFRWPVAFQYMGCFILAYATGILLFGSLFGRRIQNAHGVPTAVSQPNHTT